MASSGKVKAHHGGPKGQRAKPRETTSTAAASASAK
jgi:hypothetical protein